MTGLPRELAAWVEEAAGGRVTAAGRRPGGARKEAWFVDVTGPGGEVEELFLRHDPSPSDPWTVRREAVVYRALQGSPVPVPGLVAVHPTRDAMLTRRVTGGTWFSQIADAGDQLRTAQDFVRHLAALHRIDPATLDLPGFPPVGPVPDLVRHELDECESVLAARGGQVDPALRFALDWLRAHVPGYEGPAVLVQGDTGPGNFLYAGGRVVAVVDWELAHLGDPMDDVAWLSLRAVQEPFTHLPDRLAEYERWSGHAVDADRARYYRVMAETKLQVMVHGVDAFRGDLGNALIYRMLHLRLWLDALADAVGFERVPPEPPPADDDAEHEHGWLYGAVLDQLRHVVVPAVGDPVAAQRAKGVARAVKYLAAVDRHGAAYDRDELEDAARLLGARPPSVAAAREAVAAAVAAGTVAPEDYLAHLWRRVARRNELMRDASGVLADRHWPPLR